MLENGSGWRPVTPQAARTRPKLRKSTFTRSWNRKDAETPGYQKWLPAPPKVLAPSRRRFPVRVSRL